MSLSKRWGIGVVLAGLLLMAGVAAAQSGGPYEMVFSTIDAGGGVSSGGPYVMMDTIGQPEPGSFSGGQYEFVGGFWSAEASPQLPLELSAIIIR
jgi:hypothetical protein